MGVGSCVPRVHWYICLCLEWKIIAIVSDFINNTIYLDGWKVEYRENSEKGEVDL